MSDNNPKPINSVPIYGYNVEVPEVNRNGEKVPFAGTIQPVLYGELDVNTGEVTYYGKPICDINEDKQQ